VPITKPEVLTAASVGSEVDHVKPVRVCVVPSEYVPVATNCCDVPFAKVSGEGVSTIESSAAGVTVSIVLPVTPLCVAVIVVEPCANADARPMVPGVMLIVATAPMDEDQLAV
jgi:hypothetical protein